MDQFEAKGPLVLHETTDPARVFSWISLRPKGPLSSMRPPILLGRSGRLWSLPHPGDCDLTSHQATVENSGH